MDTDEYKENERINRNIVECKLACLYAFYYQTSELIETLWNVNRRGQTVKSLNLLELIETLWNVNLSSCQIKHN